jgi:hypothetical protein
LLERRVNQAWLTHTHQLRYQEQYPVKVEGKTTASIDEMVRGTLTDAGEQWCDALVEHAAPLSAAEVMLWQRRQQIAIELGAASPDEWEVPTSQAPTLATQWFAGHAAELAEFREERMSVWARSGLASGAGPELPSRLSPRSVAEWFRDTRLLEDVRLRSWPLPQALAPASWVRALDEFGAEYLFATAPTDQPFIVAHDPQRLADRELGACFSLLLLSPAFHRSRLGVGRERMRDLLREFARCALLETARRALKVLLRGPALSGENPLRDAYEALGHQHLGVSSPRQLAGVWLRLRTGDVQGFVALGLGALRYERLVEEHDEDWFRNPRAIDQLRSDAQLPPVCSVDDERAAAAFDALARIVGQWL